MNLEMEAREVNQLIQNHTAREKRGTEFEHMYASVQSQAVGNVPWTPLGYHPGPQASSMLSLALWGGRWPPGDTPATLSRGDDEGVERLLHRVSANPRSPGPCSWEEEAAAAAVTGAALEAWVTPRHSCAWRGGVSLPCASRQASYF